MPSQVRIISPRNSAEWDRVVADVLDRKGFGKEDIYGGCKDEERADRVRRAVRTAARKRDLAAKVFWRPCDSKSCGFGADCAYHVYITLYEMAAGRDYKAKQSQQRR